MQSGSKEASNAKRLSRADEIEKAQSEKRLSELLQLLYMIDSNDIQDEVEYWSSCYVLGANPPLPVMEG